MSDPDLRTGFEEFVAGRRQSLLRTAYLLTGSHEDAEDLVQVALVKAVPHWARIADRPEPYVRKILARESIARWRRRRWREIDTAEVPDLPVPAGDATDSLVLRAALLQLAPRQRAVLVLRFYEDLTERQTAEALGIGVGTVKSQTRDALARLRALMPDLHDDPGHVPGAVPAGRGTNFSPNPQSRPPSDRQQEY